MASAASMNACDVCGCDHNIENCPELQPEKESNPITRSVLTLPSSLGLYSDEGAGIKMGIVAKEAIPARAKYGPFEASRSTQEMDMPGFLVFKVLSGTDRSVTLDTSSHDCNWMCLVRPATTPEEQNCLAYQMGTDIYFSTTKHLSPGDPLSVWYAPGYARKLGQSIQPDGQTRSLLDQTVRWVPIHVKRGRGRPRKSEAIAKVTVTPVKQTGDKKPRGRPKKSKQPPTEDNESIVDAETTGRPQRKRNLPSRFEHEYKLLVKSEDLGEEMEESDEGEDPDDTEDSDFVASSACKYPKAEQSMSDDEDPAIVHVHVTQIESGEGAEGNEISYLSDVNYQKSILPVFADTFDEATPCSQCSEVFLDAKELARHLISAHYKSSLQTSQAVGKPPMRRCTKSLVPCDICNTMFVSRSSLVSHMTQTHGITTDRGLASSEEHIKNVELQAPTDKDGETTDDEEGSDKVNKIVLNPDFFMEEDGSMVFLCKCQQKFQSIEDVATHILQGECVQVVCTQCWECLDSKDEIPTHKCQRWKCKKCDQAFTTKTDMKAHVAEEHRRYSCQKCLKVFNTESHLESHKCENGTTHVQCDICKVYFIDQAMLRSHLDWHTGEHSCIKCSVLFPTNHDLIQHLASCDVSALLDQYKGAMYMCHICHRIFSEESTFNRHLTAHKVAAKFRCYGCEKTFGTSKLLKAHDCFLEENLHSYEYEYECGECEKKFASDHFYVQHVMTSHDLGSALKCGLCQAMCGTRDKLMRHILICKVTLVIKRDGFISCHRCKEKFTRPTNYNRHVQSHNHTHNCKKCGRGFSRILKKNTHERGCTLTIRNLTCSTCGKRFSHESNLLKHLEMHGEHKYKCDKCDRTFARREYCDNHTCYRSDGSVVVLRRPRGAEKPIETDPHVCELCGKSYYTKTNLNKHMKIHADKEFRCDECSKTFWYSHELKAHKNVEHSENGGTGLECEQCGRVLKSSYSLAAHVKTFHTNPMQHPCDVCGRLFRQRGNLQKHKLKHSNLLTYHCKYCPMKFRYPEQLRKHNLDLHIRGRDQQCTLCNRSFLMPHQLKKHILELHSGRTYVCPHCNEACRYKHTIRRHILRKHASESETISKLSSAEFYNSILKQVEVPANSSHTDREEQMALRVVNIPEVGLPETERKIVSPHIIYQFQQPDGTVQQIQLSADDAAVYQIEVEGQEGDGSIQLVQDGLVQQGIQQILQSTQCAGDQFPADVQITTNAVQTTAEQPSVHQSVEEIITDATLTSEVVEVLQSLSGGSATIIDSHGNAASYLADDLAEGNT